MLRQSTGTLQIRAPRAGLHEITRAVSHWISDHECGTGLLTLFCRHTSASLLIQENAAAAARSDLEAYFSRIAPESATRYTHNDEGPDDMPAHIRSALTNTQLSIPVASGRTRLGTWQGIYLFEHRREPPQRELALHFIGE